LLCNFKSFLGSVVSYVFRIIISFFEKISEKLYVIINDDKRGLFMKNIKYTIHKEGEHYVAQCMNVDVSSFGSTVEEAIDNLTEAVELYLED